MEILLLGTEGTDLVHELSRFGATKIYLVNHEALYSYSADAYSQALCQLIEETQADIILMGHTAIGKDVAPRVATKLGSGLISDCISINVEEEEIIFIRPIYSGKAFQKKSIPNGKVFATLRPNNFDILETPEKSEVITYQPMIKDLRAVIKEIVRKTARGVDLSEAKIIVSGGRGVKNESGFMPLNQLAEVLGAAVGASRGACDAGYCDYSMQIGHVTPDLYIACGISGAIQHLAGMSNSKIIVAINKDPEAPIFQVADYGIVGDLFEVVPLLTEEFKKLLMVAQ